MEKPKTRQVDSSRQKKKAAVGKQVDDFHGYVGLRSLLNPIWCFHGFRTAVIILTIFGVIMVFSSSSVNMIANGQSPWSQALKQGDSAFLTYRGCCLHDDSGGAHQEIQFRLPDYRFAFAVADVYPLGIDVQGNKGWIGLWIYLPARRSR